MPDRLATLLPYPTRVRAMPGELVLSGETPVTAGPQARQLAAAVRRVLAAIAWPADVAPAAQAQAQDQAARTEIVVDADPALPAEGYRLLIGPDRVKIAANDPAGASYAAQTIRQLLPDDAYRTASIPAPVWSVPCAEIEDAPALPWRGAHLDVSRHFFPKPTVLRFIDMLAVHKMNRLHLHLTDDQGWRIESPSHPALHEVGSHRPQTLIGRAHTEPESYDGTPHGGYYTLADLAEIASYAADRMVQVVPEVEVPGHASALLAALPELSPSPGMRSQVATGWGIMPQIISPLPATVAVLEDIFGELLGAIPAGVVHIGGDECVLDHWRDSPQVVEYCRQLGVSGPDAMHAYFLRQVADMLAGSFGARAVVWDEGFVSTATGQRLRDDTFVMAWRGEDVAQQAAVAGHDVISSPVRPTYFDYAQSDSETEPLSIGGPVTIEDVAAHQPVPDGWPEQAARHLIGTQFQLWSEYIPDSRALDYMTFPRACALAEVAWHGGPSAWAGPTAGDGDRPALRDRVTAHLGRLAAAGVEYRPLTGPRPWQQGGTGPRRHQRGYKISEVTTHLSGLTETGAQTS